MTRGTYYLSLLSNINNVSCIHVLKTFKRSFLLVCNDVELLVCVIFGKHYGRIYRFNHFYII